MSAEPEPQFTRVHFVLALLFGLVLVAAATFGLNFLGSVVAGLLAPHPTPTTVYKTLDIDTLTTRALDYAHEIGLQGDPTAFRSARLSLWEWRAIVHQTMNADESPDEPLFAFSAVGKVDCRLAGLLPPPTDSPEFATWRQYAAVAGVLDARTGLPREGQLCARTVSQLPIPLALNPKTPAPPLVIPWTVVPGTPASPAPTSRPSFPRGTTTPVPRGDATPVPRPTGYP